MDTVQKEDLRVIRTKKSLVEAFIALMRKKKFEDITINNLCDEAMIRRTTFYRHFQDKYDLLDYVIQHYRKEFEWYNMNRPNSGEKYWSKDVLSNFMAFIKENERLFDLALNSTMLPMLLNSLLQQMEGGITEKFEQLNASDASLPASPEILGTFISGGILNSFKKALLEKKRQEEIVSEINNILNTFSL